MVYRVSLVVVRLLFWLTARCQFKGRENVPRQGPLLVVSNHLSLADPALVALGLGRGAAFLAKKQLFRYRLIGGLLRRLWTFPVRRGQMDRPALRWAYQTISEGRALVMFPEGMRSRNRRLRPAFNGAALVASRSGVPILPVGISGSE